MKKVDILQQRGKSRHGAALSKEQTWGSRVEKVDNAQKCGAWKKKTWRSRVEKVDIAQQRGKSRHGAAVWKE